MSIFRTVPLLPRDPILGLPILYAADQRPFKVNLGVGTYRTSEGSPFVLSCVKKAEKLLLNKNLNKEYLPIDGNSEFISLTLQLIFGKDNPHFSPEQIVAAQAIGGTGALRVGADFLTKLISHSLFIPQPTWPNHKQVFEKAGFSVGSYPYLDTHSHKFDFNGMCQAIENLPEGSVILLHASCHNPTGLDPSFEEWKKLSFLIKKHKIIPFFDCAYQGFGDNLDKDVEAIRLFLKEGHEMLVAYSFSKNMGLYGERIGMVALVSSSHLFIPAISSQLKALIRSNYSSPPLQGERIVSTILKTPELFAEWNQELAHMTGRVSEMRNTLIAELLVRGVHNEIASIKLQKGLFAYLKLSKEQVNRLVDERGIYLSDRRINLAGLTAENIVYVADSIKSVMMSV